MQKSQQQSCKIQDPKTMPRRRKNSYLQRRERNKELKRQTRRKEKNDCDLLTKSESNGLNFPKKAENGLNFPKKAENGLHFPKKAENGLNFPKKSENGLNFPKKSENGLNFPQKSETAEDDMPVAAKYCADSIAKLCSDSDAKTYANYNTIFAMETSGQLLPNFKLIQASMHVLIAYKYEKDQLKNSGENVMTSFSPI